MEFSWSYLNFSHASSTENHRFCKKRRHFPVDPSEGETMHRFTLSPLHLVTLSFILASPAMAQTQPATRPGPAPRTGVLSQNHNAKLPTVFLIGDSTVK